MANVSLSTHVLLIAGGFITRGQALQRLLDRAHHEQWTVVGVDSGADHARTLGLTPHLVIGDMDSITPATLATLAAQGIELIRHPAEKDETDLELALLEVVQRGATHIRIIGGIGDRIDQSLGNIDLLHMSALRGLDVRLVTAEQTIWLVGVGEHVMQGAEGDTVSLLPWHGDAHHIITDGLYYPLRDESLLAGAARGMSNVMLGAEARVHVGQGQLLVVHTIGRA